LWTWPLQLWPRFGATEHWAKVEYPQSPEELQAARARVNSRFPIDAFNAARMVSKTHTHLKPKIKRVVKQHAHAHTAFRENFKQPHPQQEYWLGTATRQHLESTRAQEQKLCRTGKPPPSHLHL